MSVKTTFFAALCLAVAATAVPAPVVAQQEGPITVRTNMARVLRISAPAATVIIGNPGVADVTIQDPQTLVLTGKSYGLTNLIVLDSIGNPVADTLIEVVQSQADLVTMYQGPARTTLACSPTCQPTITMGDDRSFTTDSLASSALVAGAAGQ